MPDIGRVGLVAYAGYQDRQVIPTGKRANQPSRSTGLSMSVTGEGNTYGRFKGVTAEDVSVPARLQNSVDIVVADEAN